MLLSGHAPIHGLPSAVAPRSEDLLAGRYVMYFSGDALCYDCCVQLLQRLSALDTMLVASVTAVVRFCYSGCPLLLPLPVTAVVRFRCSLLLQQLPAFVAAVVRFCCMLLQLLSVFFAAVVNLLLQRSSAFVEAVVRCCCSSSPLLLQRLSAFVTAGVFFLLQRLSAFVAAVVRFSRL